MGNKHSSQRQSTDQTQCQNRTRLKDDKVVDDEKLLKVGLGLGRGDLRVEGNFQMGWHRRCVKSYKRGSGDGTEPLIPPPAIEDQESEE